MEQHTPLLNYRISSFVIGVYCVDCVFSVLRACAPERFNAQARQTR